MHSLCYFAYASFSHFGNLLPQRRLPAPWPKTRRRIPPLRWHRVTSVTQYRQSPPFSADMLKRYHPRTGPLRNSP